jgi:acyl-[acyl-carrier-protein]-phospholipid O-acyltransferase/long-chain-fatty-acid--[acyl-carrier-protein] ligase
MLFATSNYRRTIMQGIIDAQRIHGAAHHVLEDIERRPLSYRQLLTQSFIVGSKIRPHHVAGEVVGIFMPNAVATVLVFLGLQIHARIPAMLNVHSSTEDLLDACRMAKIKTMYTSRRFVTAARQPAQLERLAEHIKLVYLEDLIPTVSWWDRLRGYMNARFARTD